MRKLLSAALLSLMATTAHSGAIPFDSAWKEQGFLRFFTNEYTLAGRKLGISSDGTVSVIWRPVKDSLATAQNAAWQWRVDQGVPATDLSRKGGDDRNLAIYFVFVDPETAKDLSRSSARRLLRNPSTRALAYIWGGDHARGTLLQSPYSKILKTKILRGASTGNYGEQVDLRADFATAFPGDEGVLIGVAITADSDDTNSVIKAEISGLTIN